MFKEGVGGNVIELESVVNKSENFDVMVEEGAKSLIKLFEEPVKKAVGE